MPCAKIHILQYARRASFVPLESDVYLCNIMEHRYFFKPRVGKDYQDGFMGLRTLVLGAYHYCWYDKCRYFKECVTEGRVADYGTVCPEYDQMSDREYYRLSNSNVIEIDSYLEGGHYPAYSSFTHRMLGKKSFLGSEARASFWERVAFYNWIQHCLPGPVEDFSYDRWEPVFMQDRPSFEDVLRELRPHAVLVWTEPLRQFLDRHCASLEGISLVRTGGLGGAALGTAGGFAASGATTAAVMALGTASTGTAISALSGAAATNATLAALGGGSLAAGGGGIALGTTILGAATLGVGLLVGGVIFSCTGSKLSRKADKAWNQMISNEQKINKICNYLFDLQRTAERYNATLLRMHSLYMKQLEKMRKIIDSFKEKHVNWQDLSLEEQLVIENMVLIVGVLYNMCKVQLVQKSGNSDQNVINKSEISKAEKDADDVMLQMNKAA